MNSMGDKQKLILINSSVVQDFVSDNFNTVLTAEELSILSDLIWDNLDGFYDWIEPGVSQVLNSRRS